MVLYRKNTQKSKSNNTIELCAIKISTLRGIKPNTEKLSNEKTWQVTSHINIKRSHDIASHTMAGNKKKGMR